MIFTFAGFSVAWLADMVSGLLFFLCFLALVRGVVDTFHRGGSAWIWALRGFSEPVIRPFRRLTSGLRLRRDPAPWIAAVVLYAVQYGIRYAGQTAAFLLLHEHASAPSPRTARFGQVAGLVVWAFTFLVLLRMLLLWFGAPQYHPFVRSLARVVDPALALARRVVPVRRSGIDWSPFVLVASLWFLNQVVINTILFAP